ncbi:MAG: LamG-like jellyroll fold domain-containing protein [Anaerohalosphaeraceae bacterium]
MMKRSIGILLAGLWAAAASAYVPSRLIDDFSGGLGAWTHTVILDNNGGASNVSSWQIVNGRLQIQTTTYDGIEQHAFIRSGLALEIGDELQVDVIPEYTGTQDIGLYVGGTTPQRFVRRDYIAVYRRNNGQLFSRGFDGTTEYNLVGGASPAIDQLFIARVAVNTFEVGWYSGGVRNILVTRTPATPNAATVVGIYADVRSTGVVGSVDNLRIVRAEFSPHNPNPAHNAAQVGIPIGTSGDVDLVLSWNVGVNPNNMSQVNPLIRKHYVYLSKNQNTSTDPNLYYTAAVEQVGGSLTASYMPTPPLKASGKYVWKIEHGLDNGQGGVYPPGDPNNIVGPTWTFETISMEPIIQTQPVSTSVRLGQSLSPAFSVSVFSVSPVSYQWYYSADAQIDASDTPVGGNSPTLSILNASVSNQGHYYCRIWNEATQSGGGPKPDVYSNVVSLTVGRLVAAYGFENNLNDSSGEGNHGQAFDLSLPDPSQAVPVFTTDRIQGGYALQLNGVSQYVDFGTSAYPKAGPLAGGIGGGLDEGTITCWVKASKAGGLLTNYNDGITTGFAMTLEPSGTTADARINVRGEAEEIVTVQGRPTMTGFDMLTDNQWHMITVVWKAGTIGRVYVDGGIVAEDTILGTPALYAAWQRGVLLGATRTMADRNVLTNFYGGLIDDLRVYNYAWTPEEIAAAYTQVTGKPACVNPNFDGSQFNFDNSASSYCRIDLADLAVFVQKWLASGLQ